LQHLSVLMCAGITGDTSLSAISQVSTDM